MTAAGTQCSQRRVGRGVLIAGFFCVVSSRAQAASPAAEALFEEGRRLLEAGRTDEACVKLGDSFAQEASSGTLLNLALCHETQGKVATAWAEYRAAARLARNQGRADRAATAEGRALLLEPKLPRLTLTAERRAPGTSFFIDDNAIGEGALGLAVPVDPGEHRVSAGAPGHVTWTANLTIAEAERQTLEIPALEPEPAVATTAPMPLVPSAVGAASAPAPSTRTGTPRTPVAEGKSGGSVPIAGWIVGGVGVVGLGVAAGFGLSSLASYREADGLCPPPHDQCSEAAISERTSAESKAWVSNVALGVGLVAVGVGAYLVVTSSSGSDARHETVVLRATPIANGGWLGASSAF